MDNDFVQACISAYIDVIEIALPITFFIAGCNIAINMIVGAFTGGRLHIGGK